MTKLGGASPRTRLPSDAVATTMIQSLCEECGVTPSTPPNVSEWIAWLKTTPDGAPRPVCLDTLFMSAEEGSDPLDVLLEAVDARVAWLPPCTAANRPEVQRCISALMAIVSILNTMPPQIQTIIQDAMAALGAHNFYDADDGSEGGPRINMDAIVAVMQSIMSGPNIEDIMRWSQTPEASDSQSRLFSESWMTLLSGAAPGIPMGDTINSIASIASLFSGDT